MWEQCNRVGVRLYPLRGCVSVTVCVLGFAENVVGSVCSNLSVWKHLSVWISPRVCANMCVCVRRSNLWRVSSSWRGEGFACSLECTLKVFRIICFMEKMISKSLYQFFHTKSLDQSIHSVFINNRWHAIKMDWKNRKHNIWFCLNGNDQNLYSSTFPTNK